MTNALTVISIAQAGISRGQRAWNQIKATAEEQRVLWLEVGVALMYGKLKENRPKGQKFSEWVQDAFPGLTDRHEIADALWYAAESVTVTQIPAGISHPSRIRRWWNEQQATQDLPQDLLEVAPEPSLSLPQRDAERVAKVALRAASSDEGSDIAKRQLGAIARKHGTTEDTLIQAAKNGAPDTYFRHPPTVQVQLDEFRSNLRISIDEMEEAGISRDAIKAIFIHFASTI